MQEGFYWIKHVDSVQVAYFKSEEFEDISTGEIVPGVWHLTRDDAICHNSEVSILAGPLEPPG
ncbi:hypothetical protein AL922_17455 [Salmonella enterica subsp. enterica serovar Senftenberg]|uniref:hypothetical protein n=1 Tax=unclassified Citrobacter TaxID=2644389 RepID=UPI001270F012|nr:MULTISPECIES: hypothetical protein [Citrobacter]EAO2313182.1 hypothetical protein [Salmonella enterica subsp. enterica serovar Uganda]EBB7557815.1 hypothetical protein [Salmonella enterica subsp. enterica serovar Senftenberg]ECH3269899.1 hypothetical protein [Salmonella enterica]ECV9767192.1 hypothetical protein [Salmonella enterica subsp. enterica serovar Senftenberg]MDM2750262.1 hypothetical protein [Citrobacter sp. Cs237]